MAKVNWIELKKEYIASEIVSYKSLAEKYSLDLSTVAERASKEKWVEARQEVLLKADQMAIENSAETIAEVKSRHIKLGKVLQAKGMIKMQDETWLPKSYRDSRESIVDGVNLERKAYDLDNPKVSATQNNYFISPTQHFDMIKKSVEEREGTN